MLKSGYHKWQVPQNVRSSFPPTVHIQIGLELIKVWYVDGQEVDLVEVYYVPSINDLCKDLTSQDNMAFPIPS